MRVQTGSDPSLPRPVSMIPYSARLCHILVQTLGGSISCHGFRVTSKGDGLVNQHFGHASEFLIYRASKDGTFSFIGARRVGAYCSGIETCGDAEDSLDRIINMISDCNILLTSRIGKEPHKFVSAAGIEIVQTYDSIETAIRTLLERTQGITL